MFLWNYTTLIELQTTERLLVNNLLIIDIDFPPLLQLLSFKNLIQRFSFIVSFQSLQNHHSRISILVLVLFPLNLIAKKKGFFSVNVTAFYLIFLYISF